MQYRKITMWWVVEVEDDLNAPGYRDPTEVVDEHLNVVGEVILESDMAVMSEYGFEPMQWDVQEMPKGWHPPGWQPVEPQGS